MTELLHQINEFVGLITSLIYFLPHWTSAFLLFCAVLWLHVKLRARSTLVMAIGFGLAAGTQGYSYFTSGVLFDLLHNLSFIGYWVGLFGIFWFVSGVKKRQSPNKSLKADALKRAA